MRGSRLRRLGGLGVIVLVGSWISFSGCGASSFVEQTPSERPSIDAWTPGWTPGVTQVDAEGGDGIPSDPCDPNPCFNDGICTVDESMLPICACAEGWAGAQCNADIDECATVSCPDHATCENTPGSYSCPCDEGYVEDVTGESCVDVDECTTEPAICGENALCTNTVGDFECACAPGYQATDDGICADIDECADDASPCDPNEVCTNQDGGHTCSCADGYTLSVESDSCVDVDECALDVNPCGVASVCTNIEGSYTCACLDGYAFNAGEVCVDVDECADEENPCGDLATCENTPGGFSCACIDGYEMSDEGCVDSDECGGAVSPCAAEAVCTNTIGGYDCACGAGYEGDGFTCTDLDECAPETLSAETFSDAGLDGWTLSNDDLSGKVGWHVTAEGTLQYSNAAGTSYPGTTSGYAAMPKTTFPAGGTLGFSVSLDLGDKAAGLDQVHVWILACNDNSDLPSCLVDAKKEVPTKSLLLPLWSKEDYYAATLQGLTATFVIDIGEAAGMTGWVLFSFDSVSSQANFGDGPIFDDVILSGPSALNPCSGHAVCTNTLGSATCACKEGFNGDGTTCTDIDECDAGLCGENATCINTAGSFHCLCEAGFEGAGSLCGDIDECAEGLDNCAPEGSTCTNIFGGFTCTCDPGFVGDGTTCDDVDECADKNGGCAQTCTNTIGGATCACTDGYTLLADGLDCEDIDECQLELDDCHVNAACNNSDGGYSCKCLDGFSGNGQSCTDIDECDAAPCHALAQCENSVGGFKCTCDPGYGGDGFSCQDVDECAVQNGGCLQTCVNTFGGFSCECSDGYTGDGLTCDDVDECAAGNGGCPDLCVNTVGGFTCDCSDGYTLSADGASCDDIDECADGSAGCDVNATCENTEGGFTCTCDVGFEGDGFTCDVGALPCDDDPCLHEGSCENQYLACGEATPDVKGCALSEACEDAVCGDDKYCCKGEWDGICANKAKGEFADACAFLWFTCSCAEGWSGEICDIPVAFEITQTGVVTETFAYTGDGQVLEIPDHIDEVHIEAWGAAGGPAVACGGTVKAAGGLGGYATGLLSDVAGATLYVMVGGQGVQEGSGGFNGGGNAGEFAGSGGGASDVRVDSKSLSNRAIVAGGGGGGNAHCLANGEGGWGGGTAGGEGAYEGLLNLKGGGGGTQDQGGKKGTGGTQAGFFGVGGGVGAFHEAGGGGGWYGGGSSAAGGGGGGSGALKAVTDGHLESGVWPGHGVIVITYGECGGYEGDFNAGIDWVIETSSGASWDLTKVNGDNMLFVPQKFGVHTKTSFARKFILSEADSLELRYWIKQSVEEGSCSFDTTRVKVNDVTVDKVCGANYEGERVVDLSAYAGTSITIRFEFDTVDGQQNLGDGVYIDDISVGVPCD